MQTVRHRTWLNGGDKTSEDCFIPIPGATMQHYIFHITIVTTDY